MKHIATLFLCYILIILNRFVFAADDSANCHSLAKEGKCLTETNYMTENCDEECKKWKETEKSIQFQRFPLLDVSRDELYDLQVKRASGDVIKFDRFEGYVTLLLPIAKTCSDSKVSSVTIMEYIESLQKVWPYSVEILVFPFEHPSINYDKKECEDFEVEYQKSDRNIHMMEISKRLNGPDTPVVFKFIKKIMGVEELNLNTTLYFLIHPDFNTLEYHYGKSLLDMKDILRQLVKKLDPSKKLEPRGEL